MKKSGYKSKTKHNLMRKLSGNTAVLVLLVILFAVGCSAPSRESDTSSSTKESIGEATDEITTEGPEEQTNENDAGDTLDVTETAEAEEENSGALKDREYWDTILPELKSVFREHGLFIFRTDFGDPYCNFYLEYGVPTEDGKYIPCGLEQAEYEEKIASVKKEVYDILDKYVLYIPDSLFKQPNHHILGLHFHSRFIKVYEYTNYREVIREGVADYQIELLYYYAEENGKENKYDHVTMDEFWAYPWEYNLVYTP